MRRATGRHLLLAATLCACLIPVLMYAALGVRLDARPDVGGEVLMQLVNAFGEELLFRGVICALMSACAGMMFTAARYRTGSLWLLVLLHMVLNLASIYSNVEFVAGPDVNLLVQRATRVVELVLAACVMVGAVRRQEPALTGTNS